MSMKAYSFLITIFLFSNCTNNNQETKMPKVHEISGIWVSKDNAVLSLFNNGTCKADSLPADVFLNSYKGLRLSGSGKWEIKKSKGPLKWEIKLDIDFGPNTSPTIKENGVEISLPISGSGVLEKSPPWKSIFVWIDEDSGERYEFNKK